jgi:hypothetical protein
MKIREKRKRGKKAKKVKRIIGQEENRHKSNSPLRKVIRGLKETRY